MVVQKTPSQAMSPAPLRRGRDNRHKPQREDTLRSTGSAPHRHYQWVQPTYSLGTFHHILSWSLLNRESTGKCSTTVAGVHHRVSSQETLR